MYQDFIDEVEAMFKMDKSEAYEDLKELLKTAKGDKSKLERMNKWLKEWSSSKQAISYMRDRIVGVWMEKMKLKAERDEARDEIVRLTRELNECRNLTEKEL